MDFKIIYAINLKKWFCSKSDEELSYYLIHQLIDNDSSVFKQSIPKHIYENWSISLQLLSGKRFIINSNNINIPNKSIVIDLELKYKNSAHCELNRIRKEFSDYIDSIIV